MVVPAISPLSVRHLPNCRPEQSRLISATCRDAARYRKHPHFSTCRVTSRSFRNACKGAIGPRPEATVTYHSFSLRVLLPPSLLPPPHSLPHSSADDSSVLFHVGVRSAERKKMLAAPSCVPEEHEEPQKYHRSVRAGDQRESEDSTRETQRRPAGTPSFSHPEMSRRRMPSTSWPLRLFFKRFYTSHPEVDTRAPSVRHHSRAPPSRIIKLLYSDFAQTGFAERRCNFLAEHVSLKRAPSR